MFGNSNYQFFVIVDYEAILNAEHIFFVIFQP